MGHGAVMPRHYSCCVADPEREEIIRTWYANHYSSVTASANGSGFERFLHRSMERRFGRERHFARVLEVGGNRGEHVPYVRHGFDSYIVSDLHPPQLPASLLADSRISVAQCDASDLPWPGSSFDRVIVTCLMHHVESPLRVFQEVRRVARPGAVITVMIPTDPSFAYRAGVWLSSRRTARRQGLVEEMYLVKALDHRNHYRSIATQAAYVLSRDEIAVQYLPFRIRSVELNAFTIWQVRVVGG